MKLYKSPLVYCALILVFIVSDLAWVLTNMPEQSNYILPMLSLTGFLVCGLLLVLEHDIRSSNLSLGYKFSIESALSLIVLCSAVGFHQFMC